jgi:hypothetical protein
MDRMLRRAVEKHEPITVYVNPDNPQESMIDHTLRWKLMAMIVPFAVGFGGVGLGAFWVLLSTLFSREPEAALSVPGAAPPAPARRSSGLAAQWAFTIMWNAIALPIGYIAIPSIWQSGEWVGLIVAIFPLIGMLMLVSAIWSTFSAIGRLFRSSRGEGVDMNALAQAATMAPRQQDAPGATVFARGMLSEDGGSTSAPSIAPVTPPAQASAAAAALDPDAPQAPAPSPASEEELARFEKVLKDGKLDAHARAELAKLPPGARKLVMLVLQGGSWIPKIMIAIVVLIIIADLVRSFLL